MFTASTQTAGGDVLASANAQAVAQVDVTLTINNHKYVSWLIGDADFAQLATKYQLSEKYATEAKKVLLQTLEDALFGLHASLSATPLGSAAAMSDLVIRQGLSYMDSANFEADMTAFFFHPVVFWTQVAGLSKFAPNYASNLNIVAGGTLGSTGSSATKMMGVLYGRPVYMSSRVVFSTTYKNLLLHKSAFGFAVQNPEGRGIVRVQLWEEKRLLSHVGACDIRYGVAALRTDAGIALLSDASTVA